MDVFFISLVVSSMTPFLFWYLQQRWLAVLQIPFVIGMWMYLADVIAVPQASTDTPILWVILFYSNLIFAQFAVGFGLFRIGQFWWGKEQEKEQA